MPVYTQYVRLEATLRRYNRYLRTTMEEVTIHLPVLAVLGFVEELLPPASRTPGRTSPGENLRLGS